MWADEPETPEELLIRKRYAEEARAVIERSAPRTRAMFKDRLAGATYGEIGARHGVSGGYARESCARLLGRISRLDPDYIEQSRARHQAYAEERAREHVACEVERLRVEREEDARVRSVMCDHRWRIAALLHFFTGRPPGVCGEVQGLARDDWDRVWSAWGKPLTPANMPPIEWRNEGAMSMEDVARACDETLRREREIPLVFRGPRAFR